MKNMMIIVLVIVAVGLVIALLFNNQSEDNVKEIVCLDNDCKIHYENGLNVETDLPSESAGAGQLCEPNTVKCKGSNIMVRCSLDGTPNNINCERCYYPSIYDSSDSENKVICENPII